ncbi:MAG: hypothetical protein PHN56_03280 [Candidatus Nanoarchaeia archaeon]|nr:hypothetical protein [Candidatus Nanoarchaeia archaeon]
MNYLDSMIADFFSEKITGTRKDIINYISNKGVKAARTTIYEHLNNYERSQIKESKTSASIYFYRSEDKETALELLKEKDASVEPLIKSFFEENIIGTRQEIICYVKRKRPTVGETTVFDNLESYEAYSSTNHLRGRPIIYYFKLENKEKALKLISRI